MYSAYKLNHNGVPFNPSELLSQILVDTALVINSGGLVTTSLIDRGLHISEVQLLQTPANAVIRDSSISKRCGTNLLQRKLVADFGYNLLSFLRF